MEKSAALFSMFLFGQSGALAAAAAIPTIEPGGFANGTNISTLIPGGTLSEAAASLDTGYCRTGHYGPASCHIGLFRAGIRRRVKFHP